MRNSFTLLQASQTSSTPEVHGCRELRTSIPRPKSVDVLRVLGKVHEIVKLLGPWEKKVLLALGVAGGTAGGTAGVGLAQKKLGAIAETVGCLLPGGVSLDELRTFVETR